MKQFAMIALAAILFMACGETKQKEKALSKEELVAKVDALHDSLVNPVSLELSERHAKDLMAYCKQFANAFPKDSLAPEMLYKASRSARGLKDFTGSIELYNKIINTYPEFSKLPECYFFKAFVYDNDLKDKKQAEDAYNEVIAKFPTHRFAQDAKLLIEHLYLTDEELIKLFEEKNKTQEES